jgi:hypothetical protein
MQQAKGIPGNEPTKRETNHTELGNFPASTADAAQLLLDFGAQPFGPTINAIRREAPTVTLRNEDVQLL